jgi:hypothetical protein
MILGLLENPSQRILPVYYVAVTMFGVDFILGLNSGREYRRTAICSGATFVLENPGKCAFTKSTLVKVQSIAMGGVCACPKQTEATASSIVTVIVLDFTN